MIQKRKDYQVQKRYDDKKESLKQYKKEKYLENPTLILHMRKENLRRILKYNWYSSKY